jgi:peptidoglycan-associated lipoprotein
MRMKLLPLLGALLLVVGCESAPDDTSNTKATSMAATAPQAGSDSSVSAREMGGPKPGSQEDLAVNVGDRVYFAFDKYDLSPEARAILQKQAVWLRRYPAVTVSVEGHTDERGTREYNLALGERRATSVRDYLTALGVEPSRLKTISYGKERPVALGSNEDAWSKNRRAVTVVTGGPSVVSR